ncbi:MAG: signal peptide peptidase SppA [Candidatus Kuenenia sp.]|nr:signal peptide peptidase SppA [Candidatus Kuenenia hertensis]
MRLLDVMNSPWAILPAQLQEIQNIYLTHLRGEKIDIKGVEDRLGKKLKSEQKRYEINGNVAILPIEGVLAKKMNLFSEISGGTSTELIINDLKTILQDESVKTVILNIDSTGGSVDGTPELANAIFEARKKKKIIAHTSGNMASAAYWIGSAADAVVISSDVTQVGSIGVVATHVDKSMAEDMAGIKTTEIVAGKYKRIASQYAPLTQEGRQTIQEHLDYIYSVFIDDIAKFRDVSVERVLTDMADGRVFIGKQAIKAGLVDGISTLEALIADLNAAGERAIMI